MNSENEFIRDNGRVRFCDYNFSRMNIFQWWWFEIRYWSYYRNECLHMWEVICLIADGIKNVVIGVILLLCMPLFIVVPVLPFIRGYGQIKRSKRELSRRAPKSN